MENEEKSLKRQRTSLEPDAIYEPECTHSDKMTLINLKAGLYEDVIPYYFRDLSFKDIRAGRCVSQLWRVILTSDNFCRNYSYHFLPANSKFMDKTPEEFIRYWSTPSFEDIPYYHFACPTTFKMSADGSIIVGHTYDGANKNNRMPAVLWRGCGITPLSLINNKHIATARGVNDDGSIIVGDCAYDGANKNKKIAVWWINRKITLLPMLNNGDYATAHSVNGDGSIVVGEAHDGANNNRKTAVRWINRKIMLIPMLNNGNYATAHSVNGDGSVVVGEAHDGANNNRKTAVRWINEEITLLPMLNNGNYATAHSVNGDGSIVVGEAHDGANNNRLTAVLWKNGKVFSIQEMLEKAGISLKFEGIQLIRAVAISANGLQVIGIANTGGAPFPYAIRVILPSKYSQ